MDLRNEYLQADEANKRFLEQRYGKRVIQKALEEMESKEWLEKNLKELPMLWNSHWGKSLGTDLEACLLAKHVMISSGSL